MAWKSARNLLPGLAIGIVLGGLISIPLRGMFLNTFRTLTGFTVEDGILETKVPFEVFQEGIMVGRFEKGMRLILVGNTDKMTRLTADIAWPEVGPRSDYFVPTKVPAFIELQTP